MTLRILTILCVLLLAGPAWGKWIIVDDTGTVRDISSSKANLSLGYRFSGAKVVELPSNTAVDLLYRWDGKKVIPYSGTEKERRLELINYSLSEAKKQLDSLPSSTEKIELQKFYDEVMSLKTELEK